MRTAANRLKISSVLIIVVSLVLASGLASAQNRMAVSVDAQGQYLLGPPDAPTLISGVAAKIDGHWVHSADYPKHTIEKSSTEGYLGAAQEWRVSFSGLAGTPDLLYRLRAYSSEPFVDVQVTVRNNTGNRATVESLRSVEASGNGVARLAGRPAADRVLSDSFSEDRPAMQIRDLGDAEHQVHRAVGSQLIYNRESHQSLFAGTLTSDRFLTVLRLYVSGDGRRKHYRAL